MHRYSIIAVTGIFVVFASTAFGQTSPDQGRDRRQGSLFQRSDTNGDGKISSDEWKGNPEAFDRLDQNRDGSITQDEVQSARRPGTRGGMRGGKMLATMDKNNDGQVTRDEWTGPAGAFDRLDQNGDGSIGQDEAQAARRPGAGRDKRRPRDLSRIDKNNDGQIGRDEWPRSAEAFDRLDQNNDGFLPRDELQKARRRGGRRGNDGTT